MKTRSTVVTVALMLFVVPTLIFSADPTTANTDAATLKPTATEGQQAVAPPAKPKSTQVSSAVLNPQTGEQLKWLVVAGGGGASSSTNFNL